MQNEQAEVDQELDATTQQIKDANKELTSAQAKITKVIDDRRSLMNDRNKEMNGMEEDGFRQIQNADSDLTKFMRDTFSAFLTGSDDASYDPAAKHWSDLRNFQIALRSANWEGLTRGYLDVLMKEFSGGENPKKKGEYNPNGGKYFVEIMKPENTQANMGFYAYYRTLSKHWHFISMQRKETR
jgi:hypothetical protein